MQYGERLSNNYINDDYIVLDSDKKSRTNESLENYGYSRRKVTVLFHY